jgi:ATPase subunit of ABC transporter with duplicated ATPase domains
MATEALFNAPTNRGERKIDNIKVALDEQNEWWQRVLAFGGWSKWDSGVGQREKAEEKAEKEAQKKIEKENKKIEDKKRKDEEKKQEQERKEKEGIKQVRCSGTKSNGERCSIMIETKASRAKCTYHKSYKSNEGSDRNNNGVKEYQCKANTSSGRRCRNRTENTNKKCYAHQ